MAMKTKIDEIIGKTENLSQEMLTLIDELAKRNANKNIAYQDYVTTYLLLKIAELQEEMLELKNTFTHININ